MRSPHLNCVALRISARVRRAESPVGDLARLLHVPQLPERVFLRLPVGPSDAQVVGFERASRQIVDSRRQACGSGLLRAGAPSSACSAGLVETSVLLSTGCRAAHYSARLCLESSALQASTGAVRWRVRLAKRLAFPRHLSALIVDGVVVVPGARLRPGNDAGDVRILIAAGLSAARWPFVFSPLRGGGSSPACAPAWHARARASVGSLSCGSPWQSLLYVQPRRLRGTAKRPVSCDRPGRDRGQCRLIPNRSSVQI